MSINLRVLIIENSSSAARLMAREVRRAGFAPSCKQVKTTRSFLTGLSHDLDVILSNYTHEAINPSQALTLLKEREIEVPLIVVGGPASHEIAVRCMREGAADYILQDQPDCLGPAVVQALEKKRRNDEKRLADQSLRSSERRFRALFENSADAIAFLSDSGVILYTSPATKRVLGYSPDELHGTDSSALVHSEDLPALTDLFARMISHPASSSPVRLSPLPPGFRLRDRNGTWRSVEGTITNLLDEPGVNSVVVHYRDVTVRIEAEKEIGAWREHLQSLSRRLVEVQEAERRHLARELHDEVGQVLTGLKLMLEVSRRLPAEAADETLDRAQQLVTEVIGRVRQLTRDLRPAMIDDHGLMPALIGLIENYSSQSGVHVSFGNTLPEGWRTSIEIETAAYRVVQESLTNIARYAAANQAAVHIWIEQDQLAIRVEDKGVGFNADQAPESAGSKGLQGMRERVHLLGGELLIESMPGAGTHVTAYLPLLHGGI